MDPPVKEPVHEGLAGPGAMPPTSTASTGISMTRATSCGGDDDVGDTASVQPGKSRNLSNESDKVEESNQEPAPPPKVQIPPPGLRISNTPPGLPPGIRKINASASSNAPISEEPARIEILSRYTDSMKGGNKIPRPPGNHEDYPDMLLQAPPQASSSSTRPGARKQHRAEPFGPWSPQGFTGFPAQDFMGPMGANFGPGEFPDHLGDPGFNFGSPPFPGYPPLGHDLDEGPPYGLLEEQKSLFTSQKEENRRLKFEKQSMEKLVLQQSMQMNMLQCQLQSMMAQSQMQMMLETLQQQDPSERPWWFKTDLFAMYAATGPHALEGDVQLPLQWFEREGVSEANKDASMHSRLIQLGQPKNGPKSIQICSVINIIEKADKSSARVVDLCMRCGKTRCIHWKAGKCNVRPCVKFCHNGHGSGTCVARRQQPQFELKKHVFDVPKSWFFCGFGDLSVEDQLVELANWGWL